MLYPRPLRSCMHEGSMDRLAHVSLVKCAELRWFSARTKPGGWPRQAWHTCTKICSRAPSGWSRRFRACVMQLRKLSGSPTSTGILKCTYTVDAAVFGVVRRRLRGGNYYCGGLSNPQRACSRHMHMCGSAWLLTHLLGSR